MLLKDLRAKLKEEWENYLTEAKRNKQVDKLSNESSTSEMEEKGLANRHWKHFS